LIFESAQQQKASVSKSKCLFSFFLFFKKVETKQWKQNSGKKWCFAFSFQGHMPLPWSTVLAPLHKSIK
jgi:hypothetical protein